MQVPSLRAATAPWATTDFKSARTSSGQIATHRLTATLKPTRANWKDAGGINIHSVMLKKRICPTCALRDSSAPMKKMPVRAKCLSVALANWIAMVSGSLSYDIGLSFDDTLADQCQPPGDTSLVDTSAHGLNTNGSVCLNGVCQYVISIPTTNQMYSSYLQICQRDSWTTLPGGKHSLYRVCRHRRIHWHRISR